MNVLRCAVARNSECRRYDLIKGGEIALLYYTIYSHKFSQQAFIARFNCSDHWVRMARIKTPFLINAFVIVSHKVTKTCYQLSYDYHKQCTASTIYSIDKQHGNNLKTTFCQLQFTITAEHRHENKHHQLLLLFFIRCLLYLRARNR